MDIYAAWWQCPWSLQPHFNGLKIKLNVYHAPLLARFFFSIILMATKHLPRPLGFFSVSFLWTENETKRLLTALLYGLKMNICHAPFKVLNSSREFTWRLTHP